MFLFDMDGTLIDSRGDLADAVNATRRELGLPEVGREVVVAKVGNGMRRLVVDAIPELEGKGIDEALAIQERHYGERLLCQTRLYPGVADALQALAARGEKLGVVTNKPGRFSRAIVDGLGIGSYLGVVVGGGDCPELKPSGLPIAYAARALGVEVSAEDWLVGDNWTDLAAASAAGVRSCFCRFGFGRMGEYQPTVCVDSATEWVSI